MKERIPTYPIEELILKRRSRRAMNPKELDREEFFPLFEAARWAPSCYNVQPWRFLWTKRDSEHWDDFFSILVEANQKWCINASVLVLIASNKFYDSGEINPASTFDCGSAFQNLALEATRRDLIAHPMKGFDKEKSIKVLNIPENFTPEIMVAIGILGSDSHLDEERKKLEHTPSLRKELSEIVYEGKFPK